VRPELEVFDTGTSRAGEGSRPRRPDRRSADDSALHGDPYGAPDDPTTFMAMVNALPPGTYLLRFLDQPMQLPFVAMASARRGNVRVGLEDNIYLSKGTLASNGQLVERAVTILEAMNVRVIGPEEARKKLKLKKRG